MCFFDNIKNDTNLLNSVVSNNKQFLKIITNAIDTECNKKYIMKWINKWKNDYKRQNYKFMDRDKIYENVTNILQHTLTKKGQKKYNKKSKKNIVNIKIERQDVNTLKIEKYFFIIYHLIK